MSRPQNLKKSSTCFDACSVGSNQVEDFFPICVSFSEDLNILKLLKFRSSEMATQIGKHFPLDLTILKKRLSKWEIYKKDCSLPTMQCLNFTLSKIVWKKIMKSSIFCHWTCSRQNASMCNNNQRPISELL